MFSGPFTSPSTRPQAQVATGQTMGLGLGASELARSRTLSPSFHPSISNLIDPGPAPPSSPLACSSFRPSSGDGNLTGGSSLPQGADTRPFDFRSRPRPRMRPVPDDTEPDHATTPHCPLPAARPLLSPFQQPGQWFQLPATPQQGGPSGSIHNPIPSDHGQHSRSHFDRFSTPDSPSPRPPQPHAVAPNSLLASRVLQEIVPIALSPAVQAPPGLDPPAADSGAKVLAARSPTPPTIRDVSPASTIIITDTDSVPGTPAARVTKAGAKRPRGPLKRMPALSESEFAELLKSKRTNMKYCIEEDQLLVDFILDPEHLERRKQAQQKSQKGSIPKVFEAASKTAFGDSRDPKALFTRWGILKSKFGVIEKLENATGGNGDADYTTDDPEQTILEKLGHRLDGASQRVKTHNLSAAEYYAWVKDPVNGIYAKLAAFLTDDVSIVRKRQYRSGVVSPDPEQSVGADLDDPTNDVIDLDSDGPTTPHRNQPSPAPSSGSVSPATREPPSNSRKTKGKEAQLTAATGLAFIEEARSYHLSRSEIEKQRLTLEHKQYEMEQANGHRAEQRLKLEHERLELLRAEQAHVEQIAEKAHKLEEERLQLVRERQLDLKRKTDIDELDRNRTYKRARLGDVTTTALHITADQEGRFSQELRNASQAHILLMFDQVQDLN